MRVVRDGLRFGAVAVVVFVTWIGVYWLFAEFLHWGIITGAVCACGASALNGLTMGYNVSPLDTEA